jgi:hypothetical protein
MDSLLPFLQGTCTPYNMPVYPGALRIAGNTARTPSMSALAIYRQLGRVDRAGHSPLVSDTTEASGFPRLLSL